METMVKSLSPSDGPDSIKNTALEIIRESLEQLDPYRLIIENVRIEDERIIVCDKPFDLSRFRRIHILGAGKGAPFLFKGLKDVLGERIEGGVIVSLEEHSFQDERVEFVPGSHPIPDERSLLAGRTIMAYVENHIEEEDLVFFLLTGGASSLMILPSPPLSLADLANVNRLLLGSGADIREMNCVRKHLSSIKGGRLGNLISPATAITLMISDIMDSPMEDIGSGPTMPDPSGFEDAYQIIDRYGLLSEIGSEVLELIMSGMRGKIPETPKPGDLSFSQHFPVVLCDNITLVEVIKKIAEDRGFRTYIKDIRDGGDVVDAVKRWAATIATFIHAKGWRRDGRRVLLVAGGEHTIRVKGEGKGGRNQHFILALLNELKDLDMPFHMMSIGTDGIDGPTEAAGAWIDHNTMSKAKQIGLDPQDYLSTYDSYSFFKELDQLIITGPTRTNLMDIRLLFLM